MSKEDFLGKIVSRYLTKNFVKWFAIGAGASIVLASIVGVSLYFGIYFPNIPDPEISFTTRLGDEIASEVPNVVHVVITGNATQAIHERLLHAIIDREGDSSSYSWNVSAYVMLPSDEINFVLSNSEVDEVGTGLVTSIKKTERVGTYGVEPYGEDLESPNMKWATELYLVNNTIIMLFIDMGGLILYQTTTWENNYVITNSTMLGSAVLLPESAFDDYIQVLKSLFTPHLEI